VADRDLTITMGKRVSRRSHGNAGPVPGDVADGILRGERSAVFACESPEYFRIHGCPHGRSRLAAAEPKQAAPQNKGEKDAANTGR
jgi:hypothetical protein